MAMNYTHLIITQLPRGYLLGLGHDNTFRNSGFGNVVFGDESRSSEYVRKITLGFLLRRGEEHIVSGIQAKEHYGDIKRVGTVVIAGVTFESDGPAAGVVTDEEVFAGARKLWAAAKNCLTVSGRKVVIDPARPVDEIALPQKQARP
ncbi:MAG: hypothetical protein P4M15_12400 [Alphaproteobacteria bacterium]|nr:hypothetical protein [Alphaproteobacteria bacterium]